MPTRAEEVCQRKKRYPSIAKAKQAAREIHETTRRELRPYQCTVCKGFHLARANPGDVKRGSRVTILDGPYEGSSGAVVCTMRHSNKVHVQLDGVAFILEFSEASVQLI